MPKQRPLFKRHADHAALDFVNTLDDRFAAGAPKELLPDYAELLRFCMEAGVLTPKQASQLATLADAAQQGALRTALNLRETLARTCYRMLDGRPPSAKDRGELERWWILCAEHREIDWRAGRLAWRWRDGLASHADAPALLLAQSALELLTADPPPALGACACGTCRWLFLDISRNGTRRWCDMKTCGNRAKARRYSEAHK